LFHALAVNALNALVGNVGEPGGIFFTPQLTPTPGVKAAPVVGHWPPPDAGPALDKLSAKVLLIDGVNPVFGSPGSSNVREALEKVPFIVSFGSFLDETTSALADLILPDHSFLESWVDSLPESGSMVAVANAAGPAMHPLHQTRAMPDVLLDVAGRLKTPLNPPLPWKTFDEMLKASFADLPAPPPSGSGSASSSASADAWSAAQKQGGWWGDAPRSRLATPVSDARVPAVTGDVRTTRTAAVGRSVKFEEPRFDGDAAQFPYHLLPYASPAFYDGSAAHLPWLQEMPDPLTSAMWSSWVEINPRTAEKLNVQTGDVVEVVSSRGALRVPAVLSPGIAPDVIAIPVGQGHTSFTRYAAGRGVNVIGILAPMIEAETGALAWAATRVRVARAADADGQLILFAGEIHERPHEKDVR
ncbi:MAG TPA: molybdopterin dinucleotide binding domain-containing protein, partial [Vicinamibacterales bacterium]|nr:molybdopterin dinucleotide binding domain-containing protein [Vicinamibacterales bacterium]